MAGSRLLLARGDYERAHAFLREVAEVGSFDATALDREAAVGLFQEAAERWEQFGHVPERAYALLGQGRCLKALGDPAANRPLTEARELFASMGYKPALAETEALLQQTQTAAS